MRAYAFFIVLTIIAVAMPRIANADEGFSVVINGRTGETFLRNDGAAAISLDGYLLRSPQVDVFDPSQWSSLENNPSTPGWLESFAAGNRLGEANLFGSTSLAAGGTLSIGSPYIPFTPATFGEPEPGLGTINLTYSSDGGGAALAGDVEFIARNTVVLVIDPLTGESSLQNQSEFDINIDSYLIKSADNVLDVSGWTPLQSSLGGAGGWLASTGAANRIAEGNLFGSTFLAANGGLLPIGAPIDPNLLVDESNLKLEFTVSGLGSIQGGVLITAAAAPGVPGDYNGDGAVNAADYTVWRDRSGANVTLPNEVENVTVGMVTEADYDAWAARFGNGAGSGAGAVGANPVPEPAGYLIACMAAIPVVLSRRQARNSLPQSVDTDR